MSGARNELAATAEEVEALPTGQWVVAADGRVACLFDTHMGFPQRMWGLKKDGGTKGYVTSYTHINGLPLPLHLADATPKSPCPHTRANECGQCIVCGVLGVGESSPAYFDADGMADFQAAAAHNARIEGTR